MFCIAGSHASEGIVLPGVLAVEMPEEGRTTLPAEMSPLAELLASAASEGRPVSHNRSGHIFGIGPTSVTWTAWDGDPETGTVFSTRTENVYVFPHGQTPVGLSMDEYATAGNHGANVARSPTGEIHVAWLDSGGDRPGRIWYRRGVQSPDSGSVTWTMPEDVAGTDAKWNSRVGIAATAGAVHFVWPGEGGAIKYRRLRRTGDAWLFDDVQGTGVSGTDWDNGPDLAAFDDEEVHLLTRTLAHAFRTAGNGWVVEPLPLPAGCIGVKYPAIALDSSGQAHVSFTAMVRSDTWVHGSPPVNYYWKIWYMHLARPTGSAPGALLESHDVLANFPSWGDPGPGGDGLPVDDVVGDWVDIAVDDDDGLHLGWHGTSLSRYIGKDDAFYTRRPASGNLDPGAWQEPEALHSAGDGLQHSFTPSLCVRGTSGLVIASIMFKALGAPPYDNYEDMESALRLLQNGRFADSGLIRLSRTSDYGASTWWPDAAQRLFRHPNGRAWLDTLAAFDMQDGSGRAYVVYQRHELTEHLPVILQGDLNGDHAVDLTDTLIALKVLADEIPGSPIHPSADVNGDAVIGMHEAIWAMQQTAGIRGE